MGHNRWYERAAYGGASNRRLLAIRSRRTGLAAWREKQQARTFGGGIPNTLFTLSTIVGWIPTAGRSGTKAEYVDGQKLIARRRDAAGLVSEPIPYIDWGDREERGTGDK